MGATTFTPLAGIVGGVMIGLSAVMLMALIGRVMGVSGIVGGLFGARKAGEFSWRAAFVLGCLAAPGILVALAVELPAISPPSDAMAYMALAGVLVGFGATIGSGCTSGHGICGLSRMSRRSVTAVATFMSVAFVTVLVTRHLV